MYGKLREKYGYQEENEMVVTENGTSLFCYVESALLTADELVNGVIELFANNSSVTVEELEEIKKQYEVMFDTTEWNLLEIPLAPLASILEESDEV